MTDDTRYRRWMEMALVARRDNLTRAELAFRSNDKGGALGAGPVRKILFY